jgi:hypothetical protein
MAHTRGCHDARRRVPRACPERSRGICGTASARSTSTGGRSRSGTHDVNPASRSHSG